MIVVIGCNENLSVSGEEKSSNEKYPNEKYSKIFNVKNIENSNCDQIAITDALEEAALALSKAIKNREMRLKIKEEVGKKFDGDYDVLYKNIKDHQLSGNSFSKVFASGYKESKQIEGKNLSDEQAESELSRIINMVPKFQISIPVNFDKWNADKDIPLIAFRPLMKDKDVKKIKAVDEKGNIHWLDAKKKPEVPVIVVCWNERTDDEGKIKNQVLEKYDYRTNKYIVTKNEVKKSKNSSLLYDLRARFKIDTFVVGTNTNQWDAWFEGNPEFYIESTHGIWWKSKVWFSDCVIPGGYYETNRELFWVGTPVNAYTHLEVWEDDEFLEGGDDQVEQYFKAIKQDTTALWQHTYAYYHIWVFGSNSNVFLKAGWEYYEF